MHLEGHTMPRTLNQDFWNGLPARQTELYPLTYLKHTTDSLEQWLVTSNALPVTSYFLRDIVILFNCNSNF